MHILHPFGALVVHFLRNERSTSCKMHMNSRSNVRAVWGCYMTGSIGTSAVTKMVESFENKLSDQLLASILIWYHCCCTVTNMLLRDQYHFRTQHGDMQKINENKSKIGMFVHGRKCWKNRVRIVWHGNGMFCPQEIRSLIWLSHFFSHRSPEINVPQNNMVSIFTTSFHRNVFPFRKATE